VRRSPFVVLKGVYNHSTHVLYDLVRLIIGRRLKHEIKQHQGVTQKTWDQQLVSKDFNLWFPVKKESFQIYVSSPSKAMVDFGLAFLTVY